MSNKTVQQLAEIVKIPLEKLLEQLKEAGLSATAPDDVINEDEKMQLLAHLRKRHGKDDESAENSPRRVTLKRRSVTELKQASAPGSGTKTISIEVRKQKTYIKREAEADESKIISAAKPIVEEELSKQVVESLTTTESPVSPEIIAEVSSEPEELAAVEEKTEVVVSASEIDIEPDVEDKFGVVKVDADDKKVKQDKPIKTKEAEELKKKQLEKELRLEESIKRNADKVRQLAAAKEQTLHRKKQEDSARVAGKDNKKGKKKRQKSRTRGYRI